jgi:hypothetical protein
MRYILNLNSGDTNGKLKKFKLLETALAAVFLFYGKSP